MDWESADTWRWIWLVAAAVFALGELAIPTSFFLVSFTVGALAASATAFASGELTVQWVVFVGVSALSLLVIRPLARRIDRETEPVATSGAHRWVNRVATVLTDIPGGAGETGLVRIEREQWRAESNSDVALPAGTTVKVVRVDGTRLVVEPTSPTTPASPASPTPSGPEPT
jgi:membrane protein implicated in regulation of membrane protease activity